MLTWTKWKSLYGYKHTAETLGFDFEIEKKPAERPFKKKHWHLTVIRKGVLGSNRVALYEKAMTARAAKDRAGEFLKSESAVK